MQVLIVTGGYATNEYLTSTELLDYSAPAGKWRIAGHLPSKRRGLKAAKLNQVVHVTGGFNGGGYKDSIMSWSHESESWTVVGYLAAERDHHGVAEVSLAAMEDYCVVL